MLDDYMCDFCLFFIFLVYGIDVRTYMLLSDLDEMPFLSLWLFARSNDDDGSDDDDATFF